MGGSMRRTIIFLAAFTLLLAPAGTALARGDGWQPAVFDPFDWSCGTTTVHVSFPVNRYYVRYISQPDGSTLQQATGFVSVLMTTDAGKSVSAVISGPGRNVIYPNGDFEFHSFGRNSNFLTAEQAEAIGLPEIFLSSGLIDLVIHPDGTITWIRIPNAITDACAELT
jgi:hypothetical protein